MSSTKFKGFEVGADEKAANLAKFKQIVKDAIGDEADFDKATLPVDVRKWMKDAAAILTALET